MTRIIKILSCVVLSFMFSSLCIGYANMSDSLTAEGFVNLEPQAGVYITNVDPYTVPADTGTTVHGYMSTLLNTTVTLGQAGSSKVVWAITVFNNSNEDYGYNVMKYSTDAYSNTQIITTPHATLSNTSEVLPRGTLVAAQQSLTFYVTCAYENNTFPGEANRTLTSTINYEFLPLDQIEIEDEDTSTVKDVMGRFKEIINNDTDINNNGVWDGDELATAMANDSERDDTYISNVAGAKPDDQTKLNDLFIGNLHVVLDGVPTEVKIMIKRENLVSAAGNEYVIYMTTDNLELESGRWGYQQRDAIVYRCVFYYENGQWIQSADGMVKGTAPICDYSNGYISWWAAPGSFDTRYWEPA